MKSIDADPEDIREILHATKIIHKAITDNELEIVYVMEALQGLYAEQASRLVPYEEYCEKIDIHKDYYKAMWKQKS